MTNHVVVEEVSTCGYRCGFESLVEVVLEVVCTSAVGCEGGTARRRHNHMALLADYGDE